MKPVEYKYRSVYHMEHAFFKEWLPRWFDSCESSGTSLGFSIGRKPYLLTLRHLASPCLSLMLTAPDGYDATTIELTRCSLYRLAEAEGFLHTVTYRDMDDMLEVLASEVTFVSKDGFSFDRKETAWESWFRETFVGTDIFDQKLEDSGLMRAKVVVTHEGRNLFHVTVRSTSMSIIPPDRLDTLSYLKCQPDRVDHTFMGHDIGLTLDGNTISDIQNFFYGLGDLFSYSRVSRKSS